MSEFDPVAFLERAVPVASNEAVSEMRELLVETLASHGVEPTVDDAGNTLASKGGDDPETHLVFNTHIDTVSPHVPFERRDRSGDGDDSDDVICGRGSCDAKGPLSAILAAFFAVEPADGTRVTLAVTPDEEVLSTGADALDLDADLYIVGEPTGLDVCTAAKGRFQGTLRLSGVASHAAEPASGVNAVFALEQALAAIRSFDDGRDEHPQLGAATLTPTTVEGGASTNQVPAECRLVLDRRSVPPESAEEFRSSLESAVRDAVPDDVGVEFSLTDRPTPFLEAFATDDDHELVQTVAAASRRAGGSGVVRPFTAATEASYFSPAPVVVFGPGVLADDQGAVAHAEREYVRTDDVRRAATALTDAANELVGDT
ncbi:M20 family metallopeptidase [Halogeometricum borinquense]|uniref:M20 family metallopeptidase n=1 Tax=Halogeometricum borinquense TaxID=60847 RepID=A0A6C0UIC5_9EURY|nr:M20 family metallopeptidase [Halogeometricum borinquense]QIB73579.1 M20 family metallopeptidase [Halogeometricum borinquense]QIQ77066.1 M20 family metallopeptidase [Halogeometricum borinquense]